MMSFLARCIPKLSARRGQTEQQILRDQLFANAYANINGYQLSEDARKSVNDEPAYLYGEIVTAPFQMLLAKTLPQPHEIFWDLGMGIGKAVMTAAIHQSFKTVFGVELLQPLYQASIHAKAQLLSQASLLQCQDIQLFNRCLLQAPWQDADVLLINATCFFGSFWQQLEQQLNALKAGTRVILVSKKLKLPSFECFYHDLVWMSWGWAQVFIYKKLGNPAF